MTLHFPDEVRHEPADDRRHRSRSRARPSSRRPRSASRSSTAPRRRTPRSTPAPRRSRHYLDLRLLAPSRRTRSARRSTRCSARRERWEGGARVGRHRRRTPSGRTRRAPAPPAAAGAARGAGARRLDQPGRARATSARGSTCRPRRPTAWRRFYALLRVEPRPPRVAARLRRHRLPLRGRRRADRRLEQRARPGGRVAATGGDLAAQPVPRPVRAGAGRAADRRRRASRASTVLAPVDVADGAARRSTATRVAPPTFRAAAAGRRARAAAAARASAASTRAASTTTAPRGGYEALRRAFELGPAGVIREVKDSKLVGRGGAAFPTGRKWEAVARAAGAAALPGLQRRRVRAGHVQGPRADRGRPVRGHRGDDDRRLRDRLRARLSSTCAASTRDAPRDPARTRSPGAPPRGFLGADILGRGLRLRHRDPPRRRRLHLRRGDGALQLDRGLPRRAAQQAAVPGRRSACSASRRSSTTSRRWSTCSRSCSRAAPRSRRSAPSRSTGTQARSASRATSRARASTRSPFGVTLRELLELAGGVPAAGAAGGAAGRRGRRLRAARTSSTSRSPSRRARDAGATLGSGVVMVLRRTVDMPAHPAAHRRVLPRRVVRPVRALPRRHRAPGGAAARGCAPGRTRGSVAGRARAARRDRPAACATRRSAASARRRRAPSSRAIRSACRERP